MPAALIAVLIVVLLASLFGHVTLLLLACRLCRVGTSFRRVVLLYLGMGATNLLVIGAWLLLADASRESLAVALGFLALQLLLILSWLRLGLPATVGKAVLVLLVWLPLSAAFGAGLVLAIKSTLVEGFIVPTGAMAETLLGYHKKITCPECGLVFPVNASREAEAPPGFPPQRITRGTCPNCRAEIDLARSQNPPPLERGDRFVTTKGILTGSFEQARGEVIVFDFPLRKDRTGAPIRYVKRLIGLPGETIAIQGGKVYVLSPDRNPDYPSVPDTPPEEKGRGFDPFMGGEAEMRPMHPNHPEALKKFEKGEFRILRKTPEQVLALKCLVYDNDHQPKDLEGKAQRWSSAGWKKDGTTFQGAGEGDKLSWLRYRHLLGEPQEKPQLITDFMGYNSEDRFGSGEHWVRDLVLECEAVIDQAQGELVLELARGYRFQARFNLADGTCKVVRIGEDGKSTELESGQAGVQKGDYRLRLSDVDERLFLWVNDKLIFPDGVTFDAPTNPCPTKNDLEPAGIAVQIKHLKLWRDTYYTTGSRADPDLTVDRKWSEYRDMPVRTYFVRPGHYFCLGDNSTHSADSRSWGLVPANLLLGRAVLVYYPPSRWGGIR